MDVSTPTAEAVHRAYAGQQDLSMARDIQQTLEDWAQANSVQQAAVAAQVAGKSVHPPGAVWCTMAAVGARAT